jgi:hypothetical protein
MTRANNHTMCTTRHARTSTHLQQHRRRLSAIAHTQRQPRRRLVSYVRFHFQNMFTGKKTSKTGSYSAPYRSQSCRSNRQKPLIVRAEGNSNTRDSMTACTCVRACEHVRMRRTHHAHLRRAVPSVAAVQQHRLPLRDRLRTQRERGETLLCRTLAIVTAHCSSLHSCAHNVKSRRQHQHQHVRIVANTTPHSTPAQTTARTRASHRAPRQCRCLRPVWGDKYLTHTYTHTRTHPTRTAVCRRSQLWRAALLQASARGLVRRARAAMQWGQSMYNIVNKKEVDTASTQTRVHATLTRNWRVFDVRSQRPLRTRAITHTHTHTHTHTRARAPHQHTMNLSVACWYASMLSKLFAQTPTINTGHVFKHNERTRRPVRCCRSRSPSVADPVCSSSHRLLPSLEAFQKSDMTYRSPLPCAPPQPATRQRAHGLSAGGCR